MATILAYTSPGLGHLLLISALLTELSRRGHKIHLRTLSTGVETGQRLGFVTDEIDPRIEAIVDDWKAPNIRAALKMAIEVFCRRAVHEVSDFTDAVTGTPRRCDCRRQLLGRAVGRRCRRHPMAVFHAVHPVSEIAWGAALRPGSEASARCAGPATRRRGTTARDGHYRKGNAAAAQQDSRGHWRTAGRVGGRIGAAGAADTGGQRQTVRVSPDRLGRCGATHRAVRV